MVQSTSVQFLARQDYVPGELMFSPIRRLSASASTLTQCFSVCIRISTMFKFSKVCIRRAALSSDNSCLYFSEKIRIDISYELHAKKTFYMKCKVLSSLINNFEKKKLNIVCYNFALLFKG